MLKQPRAVLGKADTERVNLVILQIEKGMDSSHGPLQGWRRNSPMDPGRFSGGFGGTRLSTVLAFAAMPQFLLPQSYEGLQRQVLTNVTRLCLAPIAMSQTIAGALQKRGQQ